MIRRTFLNYLFLLPFIEKLLRFFRRHTPQPVHLASKGGRYRGRCNIVGNRVKIFPPESNPFTRPPGGV